MQPLDLNETLEEKFRIACKCGHYDDCVQLIESRRFPVDTRNVHGRTGLILAAEHGHVSIVDFLLCHGADPELKDNWGYTAIMKAAALGHTTVFKLLKRKNCGLTCKTFLGSVTAVTEAARWGRNEIIKLCLEEDALLTNVPVEITGMTPLMLAAAAGHFDTVEILLEHGADLYAMNTASLSAWEIASFCNHNDILTHLTPLLKNVTPIKIIVSPPIDVDFESGASWAKSSLTPTSRLSNRKTASQLTAHSIIQNVHRRSKSADKARRRNSIRERNTGGIFKHILESNGLENYIDRFEKEEINLKIFFKLDESDFRSIGICDQDVVNRLLEISRHYKPLFNL